MYGRYSCGVSVLLAGLEGSGAGISSYMGCCKNRSHPADRLGPAHAKIAATLLIGLALPILIGCLLFAGGLLLLLPLGMIAIALGLLKACT